MTGTGEFRNVPIAPYNISSFMGRIIYSDVFDKRFLFDYYFSNQLTLSNVVRSKWFSVSDFIRFEKKQQTVAVTVKIDGNRSSHDEYGSLFVFVRERLSVPTRVRSRDAYNFVFQDVFSCLPRPASESNCVRNSHLLFTTSVQRLSLETLL